jgi:signal transduction histidine kinase
VTVLEVRRLRAGSVHEHDRALLERQVRHLVQMVDDLVELSRMTTAEMPLSKSVIEVQLVVAGALERAAPDLRARRHDLVLGVPMQGLTIEAELERLSRALANVLGNAALYTATRGRITLTAERDGQSVKVAVRDTGVGIEPALLPRLFEPFVQGRRSARRPEGGLGVGLAIARRIVEAHGGTITAESEGPGKGSTFTLLLPAAPAPPNDEGGDG